MISVLLSLAVAYVSLLCCSYCPVLCSYVQMFCVGTPHYGRVSFLFSRKSFKVSCPNDSWLGEKVVWEKWRQPRHAPSILANWNLGLAILICSQSLLWETFLPLGRIQAISILPHQVSRTNQNSILSKLPLRKQWVYFVYLQRHGWKSQGKIMGHPRTATLEALHLGWTMIFS